MAILQPGTFRVSDYRKAIPNKVKLTLLGRDFDVDHDPALINRQYDTEAGDFIPPQNDPAYLVLRTKSEHLEKTTGRKPGAAKTVTTRGSDVGEAARTRKIRDAQAIHAAAIASKSGDYTKAAEILATAKPKKPKRKIPARAFDRPVMYRGILIPPPVGKRSAISRAIRDDLRNR